jgi:hypothetical protein
MADTKLTLVVLAAGIGSRYGGLKQVDPVGPSGEIIIDYSVYDALAAGFDRVVFVISKQIEEVFRERVGKTIEQRCDTAYVFQRLDDLPARFSLPEGRTKPWGTTQAVLTTQPVIDGPFLACNADDFYGRTSYQAIADYLAGSNEEAGVGRYCMVGYRLGNTLTEHGTVSRGVCQVDADGYLQSIVERTKIERYEGGARFTEDGEHWTAVPLDVPVSMNIWGFTPSVYAELTERFTRFLAENGGSLKAEYYLPNTVGEIVRDGRATVKVLPSAEHWYGVTYAQDKPAVKEAIRGMVDRGLYPENLWGDK